MDFRRLGGSGGSGGLDDAMKKTTENHGHVRKTMVFQIWRRGPFWHRARTPRGCDCTLLLDAV